MMERLTRARAAGMMRSMSRFDVTAAFRSMFSAEQLEGLARARKALVERKDEFERTVGSDPRGVGVGGVSAPKALAET